LVKDEKEDETEEENKDRARLWLLGQKKAKKEFKPEAFTKFWSEKRVQEEREKEEEKANGDE